MMSDLTLGVVPQSSIYDEVLYEMLDHQGITYETVAPRDGKKYPVVLLPKDSEESHSMAVKACSSESNVIVADRVVPLDRILSLMRGTAEDRRDNFDLVVNSEEAKLLATITEKMFQSGLPLVRKWYWPGDARACCVFTHDVDWFEYSPFHKQVLAQSANPLRLLRLAADGLLRGKDYGWNIPETARMEEAYGFKSTFFFQTLYGRDDFMLERSADILRKMGFELGLHGAHDSHKDPDSLKGELDRFRTRTGVDSRGLRYHILKFEPPFTWELQAAAGLEYDATFYFNRFFGFRSGTCYPYRPFSNVSRLPITELPTGYMDWTSLHRKQSGREQLETLDKTRKAVEGYHGVLVANFHNTYLNEETFPNIFRTFRTLLEVSKSEGYWVATARECAQWWRRRADAQLNPRIDSGEVITSPTDVTTIVEREGRSPQMIAPRRTA